MSPRTPPIRRQLLARGALPVAVAAALCALFAGALAHRVLADDATLHRLLWATWAAATIAAAGLLALGWWLQRALARAVAVPLERIAATAATAPDLAQIESAVARLAAGAGDRAAAERRLRDSADEASRGIAEARDAQRSKTEFLAAVGDQLRQPLQAMNLFLGALQREALPSQLATVGRMEDTIDAMRTLLDELLELARLDAKVVHAEPAEIAVGAVFAAQRERFDALAQAHGVSLHWHDGGHWLVADPALLARVLHHLIGNAIGHAPRGRVLVAGRRCGDALRLEVRDSGVGIARIHQQRIFEDFVQVNSGGRREKRLGLGLPISARLAALLGTRVRVRSELGRGSTFSLVLPRATAAVDDAARPGRATG